MGGKIDGTILMPFGLNLDAGAVLKLDDKDLGKGLRFSTCVPQGCLLPVNFPAAATDAMRKGTKLVIASLNLSSNEAVTFNVSLNGFGPAMARATELAKWRHSRESVLTRSCSIKRQARVGATQLSQTSTKSGDYPC